VTNDIRLYSLETDGFEPELYLLRAAQKRKGIVPKAQNGKGNETPKPYMESDQVVGNRLLFSFLGRARISRARPHLAITESNNRLTQKLAQEVRDSPHF